MVGGVFLLVTDKREKWEKEKGEFGNWVMSEYANGVESFPLVSPRNEGSQVNRQPPLAGGLFLLR